jgi:hypothetical protein
MLLLKVGLSGGMAIREADLLAMAVPALIASAIGILIVLLGRYTLALLPGVRVEDGIATAGLFGAVSGSTLAAALVVLEDDGIIFEQWAPALYPFMDIPALVVAIVLASIYIKRKGGSTEKVKIWPIVKESLQGSALSALLLGIVLGLLTRPDPVFESFYQPLFKGLLSVLMLIMGMEAYARLVELRRVAHWYRGLCRRRADHPRADRLRPRLYRPPAHRFQPRRHHRARRDRRLQLGHLGAADAACRHSDRQPLRLRRLVHQHRHTGGDRHRHSVVHRR